MKIVAVLNRSAGNESVGDMWLETKVFDESDSLANVLNWASRVAQSGEVKSFKGNLRLTISQD